MLAFLSHVLMALLAPSVAILGGLTVLTMVPSAVILGGLMAPIAVYLALGLGLQLLHFILRINITLGRLNL
jgi:hypothetical protein